MSIDLNFNEKLDEALADLKDARGHVKKQIEEIEGSSAGERSLDVLTKFLDYQRLAQERVVMLEKMYYDSQTTSYAVPAVAPSSSSSTAFAPGLFASAVQQNAKPPSSGVFALKKPPTKFRCMTDDSVVGPKPKKKNIQGQTVSDPLALVFGINGSIPLWAKDQVLRWGFDVDSFEQVFADPENAMLAFRNIIQQAFDSWKFQPIRFEYQETKTDFRVIMKANKDCQNGGCVLASAFFPSSSRNRVFLYPTLIEQTYSEIIETLQHEIGHIFGLRHYFAPELEADNHSVIFGRHVGKSIMNYGALSVMTEADREDLKRMYELAWSGEITQLGDMKIEFVQPYRSRKL